MTGLISAGADLGSTIIASVVIALAVIGALSVLAATAVFLIFAAEYRKIRRRRAGVDSMIAVVQPSADPIGDEIEQWLRNGGGHG